MKKNTRSLHGQKNVLVAVLKDKRDLGILLRDHWYRIPVTYTPKRQFNYLAFYQPAIFGKRGKQIRYYARIAKSTVVARRVLIPKERNHPRANDAYVRFDLKWIKQLVIPIRNIVPRRISFGFTSLKSLLHSPDMLALYGVAPTEVIIMQELINRGIHVKKEHTVSKTGKRYRIDLVIFCNDASIAIECDNKKAHATSTQRAKDQAKDEYLEANGWRVVRLTEEDIMLRCESGIVRILRLIKDCGGEVSVSI